MIKGKVLITGGTGSLGRAIITRGLAEKWDCEFTTVSRNESKIWAMRTDFPGVKTAVGDVRDLEHMRTLCRGFDTVIHAGALKIVPIAETQVREAISCNVTGTHNMAIAAAEAGVSKMLLISSDKACGPTYYGVTKRLGEGLMREASGFGSRTCFSSCRYGNVLGSANSVVPFFKSLMAADKPFTIMDPKMRRFWLSMAQAVDIVLESLANNGPGDIYVPKAPALSVKTLAEYMDPQREQLIVGIRPGERLDETLIVSEESAYTTDFGDHFVVKPPCPANVGNVGFGYEYTSADARVLTLAEFNHLMGQS